MKLKEQDPKNHIFLTYLLASEGTSEKKLREIIIALNGRV